MESNTTAIRPASTSASRPTGDDAPIPYLRWVFTEGTAATHPSIGQVIPIRHAKMPQQGTQPLGIDAAEAAQLLTAETAAVQAARPAWRQTGQIAEMP